MNKTAKLVVLGVVSALTLGSVAAVAVPQREVRQTERLVQRAEDTVREIGRAREQFVTTLDVYNTLMSGSGDSKQLFNDLRRAADRSGDRRNDVRKKGEDMEKEAHKFFEEWTTSLDEIGSEELKARARERLNATRLAFSEILEAGRRAGADFDVFMGGLRDQITYLGYDLNPGGIASLQEDAERLNADAQTMLTAVDSISATISEYAEALRHQ